jgi:hypothetical protein
VPTAALSAFYEFETCVANVGFRKLAPSTVGPVRAGPSIRRSELEGRLWAGSKAELRSEKRDFAVANERARIYRANKYGPPDGDWAGRGDLCSAKGNAVEARVGELRAHH